MKAVYLFLLLYFSLHVHSQNVGIGTSSPTTPLHIRSDSSEIIRIQGVNPYISFYNQSVYRGYLSHDGTRMILGSTSNVPVVVAAGNTGFPAYFTPTGRLGLGESAPNERLHVNGNINLTGLLKINGNGGSSGQVLTSNGTANPTWTTAALSNNIRFAADLLSNSSIPSSISSGNAKVSFIRYNLNPAQVVMALDDSLITINKSGLYHFDLTFNAAITYATATPVDPQFSIFLFHGLPSSYILISEVEMRSNIARTDWKRTDKVSLEIYIAAPASVRVAYTFLGPFTESLHSFAGWLTGHLISE